MPISRPGSSPLARGTLARTAGCGPLARLIPARAGNILGTCSCVRMTAAHPRSRGEHYRAIGVVEVGLGSSPLARGTCRWFCVPRWRVRLIPARAGNIGKCPGGRHDWSAHPRSRGEHRSLQVGEALDCGSSPLARGTWYLRSRSQSGRRLIPARAGNIAFVVFQHVVSPAHPRSRGEHPNIHAISSTRSGSSPLARGTSNRSSP